MRQHHGIARLLERLDLLDPLGVLGAGLKGVSTVKLRQMLVEFLRGLLPTIDIVHTPSSEAFA